MVFGCLLWRLRQLKSLPTLIRNREHFGTKYHKSSCTLADKGPIRKVGDQLTTRRRGIKTAELRAFDTAELRAFDTAELNSKD
jgi:hypothetical protein